MVVLAVVVAGLVVGGFEVRINKNINALVGGRGTIINAIK